MSTMMQSLHIVSRSGNTRTLEMQRKPMKTAGSPVFRALRSDIVLRQLRETRDVITVARRLGVRANDVTLVVLDALDQRRAA
jgi:hypothetical protein